MKLVIFTHPDFFDSTSMSKYADMLLTGMRSRGHHADVATAKPLFSKMSFSVSSRKWLGYLDQFLVFPYQMKKRLRRLPDDTLFVFSDHALGPWVPLVRNRPHVVHCHDFLAQRSARGEIRQNTVSFTGKIYQTYIRKGFQSAENFISISQKTKSDLHLFLKRNPSLSEVVYNGYNQDFQFAEPGCSREQLSKEWKIDLKSGYILHVGGNQFYKNREAVIQIYSKWREKAKLGLPLIMVGAVPTDSLLREKQASAFPEDVHFITRVSDQWLRKSYTGASLLLFPSLDEGFGWPIAEAMASGCPVITTNKPPMNEVGGQYCFYLPPYPENEKEILYWIENGGKLLERVVQLPKKEREEHIAAAKKYSQRFESSNAIDKIEAIYMEVLKLYTL